MASKTTAKISLAKIDVLVFMKILKHAKEVPYKTAYGTLHGLRYEDKNTVEVSNCYAALPNSEEAEGNDYDKKYMESLIEIGLDNNKVGWYQICYMNNHLMSNAFDVQFDFQTANQFSIYLVYDILEVERGGKNPLRAFRIKSTFFDLNRNDKISLSKIKDLKFKNDKFFEEIPVEITNSPLAKAFLAEHRKSLQKTSNAKNTPKYDYTSYLERNTKEITDTMMELDEIQTRMNSEFLQQPVKGQKIVIERRQQDYETSDYLDFLMVMSRAENFSSRSRTIGTFLLDSSNIIENLIKKN